MLPWFLLLSIFVFVGLVSSFFLQLFPEMFTRCTIPDLCVCMGRCVGVWVCG